MAVAVDASSPIRWHFVCSAGNLSAASAAFTAPTNALLTLCVSRDGTMASGPSAVTASDSGGLTWTKRVERDLGEATNGGGSTIFTARTTSSVSRTVTVTASEAANRRISSKLYVLTGVDVDGTPVDTVGANNEGGSTTNNLTTTSVTPGGTGLLVVCDCDWNAGGNITSTDLTMDSATYSGEITAGSGYKACTSGVAVTANLDAGGTATCQHQWCQMVVRQSGGGAPATTPQAQTFLIQQAVKRARYF